MAITSRMVHAVCAPIGGYTRAGANRPKIPLFRSTSFAKASGVEASSGRIVYDIIESFRARRGAHPRPAAPACQRHLRRLAPDAAGGSGPVTGQSGTASPRQSTHRSAISERTLPDIAAAEIDARSADTLDVASRGARQGT